MKRAYFEIKENDRLADRTYEMKLTCPDNSHGVTRPGQFINIRLDGFFLRRPISVCDWTETGLTIIYKTVGAGTEAMSQMQQGERLDILTPLGNGFDVDAVETATAAARKRPVLVGGGAGVPPMYGLCRELLARGEKHLLDRNRLYFRLLRQIITQGQAAGQLRTDRTVNELVKAYALWERALLYDWCLCGGEYSLVAYTDEMTPMFLESFRPRSAEIKNNSTSDLK